MECDGTLHPEYNTCNSSLSNSVSLQVHMRQYQIRATTTTKARIIMLGFYKG